jgi:hypothetical protein
MVSGMVIPLHNKKTAGLLPTVCARVEGDRIYRRGYTLGLRQRKQLGIIIAINMGIVYHRFE